MKTNLKAMKAVYCYFFPEVRPLLKQVENTVPEELFLVTTPVEKLKELSELFTPALEIPRTSEGYVNVDEIHVPILERIVKAYTNLVPDLKNFKHKYTVPGSSEGIYKVLAKLKTKGVEQIYVLKGEYEGYTAYGEDLGLKIVEVELEDAEKLDKGYWFISNPSARNGNIIRNEEINKICDLGHKVVLDLAYVGSTRFYEFDVSHENIEALFLSMSKPYGVFRYRLGFTFSRKPINSLYGNKWFKDTVRLLQGLKLVEEIPPGSIYEKYNHVQERIIKKIKQDTGLEIKISDVVLLGHAHKLQLSKEKENLVANFARGDYYRFCLTPYFEEAEQGLL